MSLINDALKRAKTAQQQPPAPMAPAPPLHAVEPAQEAIRGVGLVLPGALALAALIALFIAWQALHRSNPEQALELNARTAASASIPETVAAAPVPPPAPEPQPPAPSSPAVPAASQPIAAAAAQPGQPPSTPAAAEPAAAPQPTPDATPVASAQAGAATNSAVVPEPPKPPPLKLQAIVLSPTRPSAFISGKTVFLGDRVGDQRVVAITKESATLVGGGQTNVLSLPE